MTLKRVGNFQTDKPDRLTQQLDAFQANVATETDSIRGTFLPTIEPVRIAPVASGIQPTFSVGDAVECDTSLLSATVLLAKPRVSDSPIGLLAIVKTKAANTVTVQPLGGALINGAATKVYAAVGLFLIYFDGVNFYG